MVYYHRWENESEQIITFYVLGNPQGKVDETELNSIYNKFKHLKFEVLFYLWKYFSKITLSIEKILRIYYNEINKWIWGVFIVYNWNWWRRNQNYWLPVRW